jgi:predicted HicB family RNase H-like nuclease
MNELNLAALNQVTNARLEIENSLQLLQNSPSDIIENLLSETDRIKHNILEKLENIYIPFAEEQSDLPFLLSAELNDQCGNLEERISSINNKADEVNDSIESLLNSVREFESSISNIEDSFLSNKEELIGRFGDLSQNMTDVLDNQLTSRIEQQDDSTNLFTDGLEECLEQQIFDKFKNCASKAEDLYETSHLNIANYVTDSSSRLQQTFQQSIDNTLSFANENITNTMQSTSDKAMTTITSEVEEQIAKMIVTSQAATAVSTTIQPFLPQIAAYKPLLPAIEEALRILREGI